MRDKYLDEMRKIMDALKKNRDEAKRRQLREEQEKDKLRNFFNQLANKNLFLKNSTVDTLRNNNQRYKDQMARKRDLLDLIKKRITLLKRNILNQLRRNNDY